MTKKPDKVQPILLDPKTVNAIRSYLLDEAIRLEDDGKVTELRYAIHLIDHYVASNYSYHHQTRSYAKLKELQNAE